MSPTLIIICIVALFCAGTFWALIDIAGRDFGSMEMKALWILVAAVPFIGFIVYVAVGIRKGKKA